MKVSESIKPRVFDPDKHCGSPDAGFAYRTVVEKIERFKAGQAKMDPQSEKWHERKRAIEGLELVAAAYKKDELPCTQTKGARTNHLGRGLCATHCDCKGLQAGHNADRRLGFYAGQKKDPELLRIVGEMAVEGKDPRDLEPDILFLRAVLRKKLDDGEIDEAVKVTDMVRKLVESENNLKLKQAVSWDAVTIMMERMAAVVKNNITDPEMLGNIMAGWAAITPIETDAKLSVVEN